jgi:hypothetical protein
MEVSIMRTGFVLSTVVLALALGGFVAASESRLLTGALIFGFVPVLWAVSRAVERAAGGDMWHFSAPYPYTSTPSRAHTTTAASNPGRKPVEVRERTDDRSTMPLAA